MAGRPREDHLPGVQQETAVPRNQAGKVGGFRPLHQQHQRLGRNEKNHEDVGRRGAGARPGGAQ